MRSIFSFDVFDTCLTRRVAVPSGLFYDVAKKTAVQLGITSNRAWVEDFVSARMKSEKMARNHAIREEITLSEIWTLLTQAMGLPPDKDLSSCELEAEDEFIIPVASIRLQVRKARQEGHRIIFVSDMYLPLHFIEKQLIKHGYAEKGDGFYISCEVGKSKSTGNLFKYILINENVSPSEVFHTGDNRHTDYAVPRKLGIRAQLFKDANLTYSESNLLEAGESFSSAARLAGAMRAFRLKQEPGDDNAFYELTSQFIGPFAMGFATWVLRRAQEDGVKRLYFLSRDCKLVWRVACEISSRFGGINCRYLYVSRQALFLPSADEISYNGMPWMKRSYEKPILKNLLAKLDLNFEDANLKLKRIAGTAQESYVLNSEEDWAGFWEALNQKPLKTRIQELIASRRETARQYFESEGLFDRVPWAVVDFGWHLACQQSLKKLFHAWGKNNTVRGYYFGLNSDRIVRSESGSSEALIYQIPIDFPQKGSAHQIFGYATFIEHIVGCADHPSVHHYKNVNGEGTVPAYSTALDETMLKKFHHIQAAVLDFVAENNTLAEYFEGVDELRNILTRLTIGFFTHPSVQSVLAIRGLSATVDQNGINSVPIVEPLTWRGALFRRLPRSLCPAVHKRTWRWLEGDMAITPASTRRVSEFVRLVAKLRMRICGR